jgi:hypothetical protein
LSQEADCDRCAISTKQYGCYRRPNDLKCAKCIHDHKPCVLAHRSGGALPSKPAPVVDKPSVRKRRRTDTLVASIKKPTRGKFLRSTLSSVTNPPLTIAQAVKLVDSGRNVEAEARAIFDELPNEATLQGLLNARDTMLWRLESSAYELKCILDERKSTQKALDRVTELLDEFESDGEDVGGNVAGVEDEGGNDEGAEAEDEDEIVDELAD